MMGSQKKGWFSMPHGPAYDEIVDPEQVSTVGVALRDLLGGVERGEPLRQGELTFIPLYPAEGRGSRDLGYLPLDDALAQSVIQITERPQATVPELQATSTAEIPVILISGEQVVGGLQNRVLNTTILVAAQTTLQIPVTCVEQGRWHMSGRGQARRPIGGEPPSVEERAFVSDEVAYPLLRKMHAKAVSASLGLGGGHHSDQGSVWSEVSARMTSTGSSSPTYAMDALYKAPERAEKIRELVEALPYAEGAVGFIAVLESRVLGAELFADKALAAAYWKKLARSYAVEALDREWQRSATDTPAAAAATSAVSGREAELLEEALASEIALYPSPGMGIDLRLSGAHVAGAGLVHEGTLIHLTLFPEDEVQPSSAAEATAEAAEEAETPLHAQVQEQVQTQAARPLQARTPR